MKNWLRKKLHNFLYPEDCTEPYSDRKMNSIGSVVSSRHHNQTLGSEGEPLRFTVYNASGGKIVEINHYDSRTDRHHSSLHIIGSGEDFGAELGKIAFVEALKKG